MNRVEEKVKDIVEVRAFTNVTDFAADPAQTLAGYHFTDITSDLMVKWLDAAINVGQGQGSAVALAGFRGVGKSHFLSVFGAILSQPELRNQIIDQHVAASAERLSRRHTSVALVRRGSCETLLEEIKTAIAGLSGLSPNNLSNSLNELLLKGNLATGEWPLVLLIDTSYGRDSRVSRDDGALLSELAEAAKTLGIFVGLALDDDIAGADGANLSISNSYTIDYLDQEHLYKIVDSHIFTKKDQSLALLQDIYRNYSNILPGFRWSEQRFTSLYPLHPATLEIAPLIRLYLQDFALLKFASEAGVKILGRPANSLIGLDEMFDAVEVKLRQVADLKGAFATFDKLDQEVVGKTPVTLRLPSKLILKGLFMLSLDGQGSDVSDIAAAMLIYDENTSGAPAVDISKLLESFFETLPDSIAKVDFENGEAKYCFKLNSGDELTDAVNEVITNVAHESVTGILLRQASEKYSDLILSPESEIHSTSCSVEWRGAIRHGEILWNFGTHKAERNPNNLADWTVSVVFEDESQPETPDAADHTQVKWRLSKLRPDEIDTIKRLHILQTSADLRDTFKDKLAAATHIQSLAVEKIWQRIFLADACLIIGKAEYRISDEARPSHTLAQLFTIMMTPVFEYRFPQHPDFFEPFGVKEAAKLTGQFFGGAGRNNSDIQRLAEDFALPLGLVELQGESYVPVSSEALAELSIVSTAFDGIDFGTDTVVKLSQISSRMRSAPIGLTRESQHLVLAALVAQRQFEFVTFSGNRINHRSLDLQIIWDDIEGIAKPFTEVYASDRLREWAMLITGNRQIKSIERSEDRLVIIDTLSGWLTNWKEARFLETFDSLPDENLNSSIWRTAANLRKTFGVLAESIDELVQNIIPLDQCLHNIADLFSDSEAEYEKKKNDLIVLRYFTQGVAKREEISTYLALCETTDDVEIEQTRRSLLDKTGTSYYAADPSINAEIDGLWQEFKQRYADHYVERHDSVMHSKSSTEKLKEILKSDRWCAFENLSDLAWFDPHFANGAKTLIRKVRHLECKTDVRQLLETKPFCSCSFSLARFERRQDQSSRLEIIINQGLLFFQSRVNENASELIKAFDSIGNADLAGSLKKRLAVSNDANYFSDLSSQEMQFFRSAIQQTIKKSGSPVKAKRVALEDFSDLLPNEVREWEDEIENLEVFTNVNV